MYTQRYITYVYFEKGKRKIYVEKPTGLHGYASRLSYQLVRNTCQCVMLDNVAETQVAVADFIKISDRWICWAVRFTRRQTDCHTDLPQRTSLPADSGLLCHCCTHTGCSNIAFCTSANCAKHMAIRTASQIQNTEYPQHGTFVPIFRIVSQQQVYWQSVHYLQCWLALSTISQHRHVCFQHPLQWCNLATSRLGVCRAVS